MLLVFDIGNTNIVAGAFQGKVLACEVRIKTDPGRTIDEYRAIIVTLLKEKLGDDIKFSASIISSVVPTLTPLVATLVKETFKIEAALVGPGIKTGLQIKINEPASVGADRVVNAVAAKAMYGSPAIVVDFGTATSFDVLSKEGNYEGGIIAPGIMISLEALARRTAKLPSIELVWPKTVLGKSTVHAMQSGSLVGYVCMVDGLIAKLRAEIGGVEHVIATGGLGSLISQHSSEIKIYEKDLTLQGLRTLAEINGLV